MAGPLSWSRLKVRLAPPSMDTGDCAVPPQQHPVAAWHGYRIAPYGESETFP
jgi:hypothetical protein